jgi:uncharacterized membrane protein YdjX (TVP38/TMEM64 family)
MKNKEIFQYILGGLIVSGFFALLILLVLSAVPTENKDLLNLVVGALIGSFSGIVSYFFGSSLGSSKKDQLLNEKITNTSNPANRV